jgi:hypothetical protein
MRANIQYDGAGLQESLDEIRFGFFKTPSGQYMI